MDAFQRTGKFTRLVKKLWEEGGWGTVIALALRTDISPPRTHVCSLRGCRDR